MYKENKKVIIKIKDNAGGIPINLINKIFDPYFTTKHQSIGTGIGLYMCSEIITKHLHGKITVKNETYNHKGTIYEGAEFKIELPINPKEKLLKKIKRQFSDLNCYKWDEDKNIFIKADDCNEGEQSIDIEEITNFLDQFNIYYKISETQDIKVDFNKL